MAARSFSIAVNAPDALARALATVRAEVSSPAGGLVFISGALTQEVERVADLARAAWRGVPVCIVPAAGVITERGEIEGASAACGVLWRGGRTTPFVVGEAGSAGAFREALASATSSPSRWGETPQPSRSATVLIFPRSDFATEMIEGLGLPESPGVCVFGAGTVGGSAVAVTAAGEVLRGRAAGVAIQGLAAPIVESSAACRLVTELCPIEETSGGMVLRVGGVPALEMLSSAMPEIRGGQEAGKARGGSAPPPQPVVFVALADSADSARYVVRPVRGIDPARNGVMVGPEAKPGVHLAFAVRDAAAARTGLEAIARGVSQQAIGSAPRFALYLSCAGRGQGLYGSADVESRILRQRFGDLPIAGMHSAFEIVPWGPGEARLALYTGVLALFRSPS